MSRFDFNLPRPMKPAEVAEVERLVNGWVLQASPAVTKVMDLTVSDGPDGESQAAGGRPSCLSAEGLSCGYQQ